MQSSWIAYIIGGIMKKYDKLLKMYFFDRLQSKELDLIKKGQEYSRIIVNKSSNNKNTNLTCIIHQDGK